MFIGKLIIGLLMGQLAKWLGEHPIAGFLVGVFFGHIIDVQLSRKLHEWHYRRVWTKKAQARANEDFLYCMFTLAGKVCASDNVICDKEKEIINTIITDRLNLGKRDKKIALKHFRIATAQKISEQNLSVKLLELCQQTPDMVKNIVLLLKEIAESDGPINQAEYRILFTVSSVFGIDPETTSNLIGGMRFKNEQKDSQSNKNSKNETQTESELSRLLKILGCKPDDNNDKIKRNYRELVAKFHPDKIQSKELPQDFIEFAERKFTEIRKAYEQVKNIKGF